MDSKNLVNLLELSGRLRLPAKWLKIEAEAGRIPNLKAGRKFLFSIEAVKQTLTRRASKGAHNAS